MRLSAKACYGTRALVDLALRPGGPTQLKELAAKQGVSIPYLARLISPLATAGILSTTRGAHGGVRLARHSDEIKMSEVIQLLEGPLAPMECVAEADRCPHVDLCAPRGLWRRIELAIFDILDSTTLSDLAARQKDLEELGEPMYHI